MSKVRAKFKCSGVREEKEYGQSTVDFHPVIDGCEENKSFAKYTPGGHLQLIISDGTEAANAFETGKQYYLDITPAD
ncbi:hypothetical protein [Carboxylicivirga marina]|uniref:hypothetical protein n=1 Tax=Carboxylicivirga marina TaxID=2800988 RepID=UPI002598ED39|nr:hypothetical protein [uncultured Carboxylicivirga sp.]